MRGWGGRPQRVWVWVALLSILRFCKSSGLLGIWRATIQRRILQMGRKYSNPLFLPLVFPRLDARRVPHHVPSGVGAGAHQWEAHQDQGAVGPRARARPQPAAAGVGVPAAHHRGHLQPVVCVCARDGLGHSSEPCQYCSVAPSSGEESQNLPGQGSQCEKLECVDSAGNVLTGNGQAWRVTGFPLLWGPPEHHC